MCHGDPIVDRDLITGSCIGCASDSALKDNISPLTDALDKITNLEGFLFYWVSRTRDRLYDPGRQIGVIAQNVAQVFPEIVGIDSRGYKCADYQKGVVPLIEVVKPLQTQSEAKQAKLEAKIKALEARSK